MGLLANVAGPLAAQLENRSLALVLPAAFASLTVLTILLNVLKQLLFKNPTEPPVVFHLVPFIGSTITYGIDPFKFFEGCRAKVRIQKDLQREDTG